jgi:protein ImuB
VAPSCAPPPALLQPGDWRATRRLLTPARDVRGLLQHLEAAMAARPPLPVAALIAVFDLAVPRRLQPRLFGEAGIDREKLDRVMDRLKEILCDPAGRSFGRPQLLDSHHPEAFRLHPFTAEEARPAMAAIGNEAAADPPRLALTVFRFRPPYPVQLRLPRPLAAPCAAGPGPPLRPGLAPRSSGPATLLGAECRLPGVAATLRVTDCAGPWRSSGDWWTAHAWSRDEWDVELSNRELYVLVRCRRSGSWALEGQYG